ncbi:MAG: hypothetical protein OEL91_05295 [Burkholderiaceae bacterium]|nr:hypothetical protein [Burkholderiaceae bacterium]
MSVKCCVMSCIAATMMAASGTASAVTASLVGDKNGFGLDPSLQSGDPFDNFFIPYYDAAEGNITDRVIDTSFSFVHNYSVIGPILAASVELLSGGWGLYGPASVYINDVLVGELSDGEIGLTEYVRLDIFDLTPLLAQLALSGNDKVEIRPIAGGIELDSGALDYSLITVTAVPEPVSAGLVVLGLAVVGMAARRRAAA